MVRGGQGHGGGDVVRVVVAEQGHGGGDVVRVVVADKDTVECDVFGTQLTRAYLLKVKEIL